MIAARYTTHATHMPIFSISALVASATIAVMDTASDVTKHVAKRYAHRIVNTVTYLSSTASLRRVLADVNADEVFAIFHDGCKIIVSAPIMARMS